MADLGYSKKRVELSGGWSTLYRVEIPAGALKFEDLHPLSSYVRQQDIARMHFARARGRGECSPHILTWTAMQTDRRASQMFPGLNYQTEAGETMLSANSFITYVLRKLLAAGWLQLHEYLGDTYEWVVDIPAGNGDWQARADAIMRWLEASIQLDLYPNIERGSYQPRIFHPFDTRRNFVRLGRCDFIRHFVQSHERRAAFNTSHFLHEHDDLISHHSGYGDAIGLMVAEGALLRPPLYRRGALLHDGAAWRIDRLSLADIEIVLPGDTRISVARGNAALNPRQPQPIALYTRAAGLRDGGQPLERSPQRADCWEAVVVNRQLASWKRGGGLEIPQNGFVLSLQDGALPAATSAELVADAWLEYALAPHVGTVQAGIQAGPILLRDGADALAQAKAEEEFCHSRGDIVGISPVRMNLSANERKARSAIGIKSDGDLLLLMVDGCEAGAQTALDSAGATLQELTRLLRAAGARDALNLSGEGSSHLFIQGGLANTPSDRRGQSGVAFERMLPSIGIVS